MLTIWDFLALALIALAVVAAITHAVREATRKLTQSKDTSKDITLDVMMARVAATGWHFALEGERYRIWHANDFAGIKREILTSTDRNGVALWLHAIGCQASDETFADCKPKYIPVDMHDDFGKPVDRVMFRATSLHLWCSRNEIDWFNISQVVTTTLMRGEVDHPTYYKLLSLARAFVSGRPVSEAELAEMLAALGPEKLEADAAQ
jgi:hypothetical protein